MIGGVCPPILLFHDEYTGHAGGILHAGCIVGDILSSDSKALTF